MTRYIYILFLALLAGCLPNGQKAEFEKRTGLVVNDSTFNIKTSDTYFANEGEYSIVFKTTGHQIKNWLSNKPPWSNKHWQVGQIPHEIGIACQFNFPERVGVGTNRDGTKTYDGNIDLMRLLNDTTNYFAYREDCCAGDERLKFHDGALLIVQPRTGMIYYSNWNY